MISLSYSRFSLWIFPLLFALFSLVVTCSEVVISSSLDQYFVFIDGGSTGCRLHVFRTVRPASSQTSALKIESLNVRAKTDSTVASMRNLTETEIVSTFQKLLSSAMVAIPDNHHKTTGLYIWCTGGMRALPSFIQTQIYTKVYNIVQHFCPFKFQLHHIQTIAGEQEGYFMWLAVNYLARPDSFIPFLTGDHDGAETTGAIDMGGASAQVVYLLPAPLIPRKPSISTNWIRFSNFSKRLYVRSYSGFGAKHMELAVKRKLQQSNSASGGSGGRNDLEAIQNPCGFYGYEEKLYGRTFVGQGNFTVCYALVREQMRERQELLRQSSLRIPDFHVNMEFWGISLLYHVTHFLTLVDSKLPFPNPNLAEIQSSAIALCSEPWKIVQAKYDGKDANTPFHRLNGRCFDTTLLLAFLEESRGLGFPATSRQLTFIQYTPSAGEVEWCLGAVIMVSLTELFSEARAEESRQFRASAPDLSGSHTVGLALFWINFFPVLGSVVLIVVLVKCIQGGRGFPLRNGNDKPWRTLA